MTTEWMERTPYRVVDVAGFPARRHTLTVFDAATGRLLAIGAVPSSRRIVQLMRLDN